MTDVYHVMMRGNNKAFIFKAKKDKVAFFHLLIQQEREKRIELVAWCIMDNHVHLILRSKIKALSLALKHINYGYAVYYNSKYKRLGHAFQERFKSQCIETDQYMLRAIRYVHNNPVKANMVSKPELYRFSSYRLYERLQHQYHRPLMGYIFAMFNNNYETFCAFHQNLDDIKHLEIKEDQKAYQELLTQKIIESHCKRYNVHNYEEVKKNMAFLNAMLSQVIVETGMPLRQIARFLDIPYCQVQTANKARGKIKSEDGNR